MSSVQLFHLEMILIVIILLEIIQNQKLKTFLKKRKIRTKNNYDNFFNMFLTVCLQCSVYQFLLQELCPSDFLVMSSQTSLIETVLYCLSGLR